jgi:PHO85 cyclin-6/7
VALPLNPRTYARSSLSEHHPEESVISSQGGSINTFLGDQDNAESFVGAACWMLVSTPRSSLLLPAAASSNLIQLSVSPQAQPAHRLYFTLYPSCSGLWTVLPCASRQSQLILSLDYDRNLQSTADSSSSPVIDPKAMTRVADMGSLVISPVVSDIGQYTHCPIMVGSDSQQNVASESASRNTTHHTSPLSTTSRSAATPSARPPNSQIVSDQASRNATPVAPSQPPVQQSAASSQAMNTTTSPAQAARAHPSQILNQHSRGFDQSGFPLNSAPRGLASSSPSSPRLLPTYRSSRSLGGSEATSPSRIKIRDLSHIHSFASEELLTRPQIPHRSVSGFSDFGRQYEISAMPVTDIIEMVAGLLTKITTTNDRQYDHLHRPIPQSEDGPPLSAQTTSVLAFHGKNVPTITILSYLSRIHKYCPTTYEVFLSLLVYFDRMTEVVNRGFLQSMRRDAGRIPASPISSPQPISPMATSVDTPRSRTSQAAEVTPPPSGSMAPEDPPHHPASMSGSASLPSSHGDLSQFFVVDSYNIHRLVIAGVTCASKFFSDVFYTNSRYAKVSAFTAPPLGALGLILVTGRRSSSCGAKSLRAAVSPLERFSIIHPGRGA